MKSNAEYEILESNELKYFWRPFLQHQIFFSVGGFR